MKIFKSTSLPLLVFDEIHVELPRKVGLTIFYAHYSQCSTKRSLQKLMDNFSSRGVKKLIQINFFLPLLVFGRKFHVEPSGKLTHNFYAHYSQCSTSVRFQKLMETLAEREKLIQINFFTLLVFGRKFTLNFPGKLTHNFLRSLQPVQSVQAFASKIDGQLF